MVMFLPYAALFNGAVAERRFDADGRMTANDLASYTYDAAGRITIANLGRNFRAPGSELYRGLPTGAGMKDRMSGLNASMSGGGQMTLFGGGTAKGTCTCGR